MLSPNGRNTEQTGSSFEKNGFVWFDNENEEEIVFMFNDIMDEIKKIELREKIESLEDKVSLNLDETLYSELLQLRNQLKRG